MAAYYNENDSKAAAWLRELIKGGHIAAGDVDERSIEDIRPSELAGYTQCHFFAGIGGWSYALRLAGWPDERAVWTGSCPCQPFSAAGKGKGFADERHLWPSWYWLIQKARPRVVFGEQVANALAWLDVVSADMEAEGYAFGAVALGAHSVGAPHIRQRLYWVADASKERQQHAQCNGSTQRRAGAFRNDINGRCELGNTPQQSQRPLDRQPDRVGKQQISAGRPNFSGGMEHAESYGWKQWRPESSEWSAIGGCWESTEFIPCSDGKSRPIEPGTFPLAHGVSGRVGLLRGYGNAIVPQVAAAFIEASLTA